MTKKITLKSEELNEIFDNNEDKEIIEIAKNDEFDEKEKKPIIKKEPLDEEGFIKNMLRTYLLSYTSFQLARIANMNEIRDILRRRIEFIGFKLESKKESNVKKEEYTDKQLFGFWQEAISKKLVNEREIEYMEKCLEVAFKMKKEENEYKKIIKKFLKDFDIYTIFLSKIRGIGELSTANLIKYLGDCSKFDGVSKLWAYCGYHVIGNKAPKREKGVQLKFNVHLRSILWNMSTNLMKLNHGYYRNIYDTEKEKHLNRKYEPGVLYSTYGSPYTKESIQLTKLHAHNRALRKLIKLFLSHYWECAREITNQPTEKHYVEKVLGHEHIISWKKVLELEGTIINKKEEIDEEIKIPDTDD